VGIGLGLGGVGVSDGLGLGEAGTSEGLGLAAAVGAVVAICDGDRAAIGPVLAQAATRTINAASSASRRMLEG
jgi:hypothetical protein